MTSRVKRQGAPLFAAAGLERAAPRPLADKLRPTRLDEVVGQDHLLGPDGALTRLLDTRTLGSLVFWGPPGTGKTTVARLLAQATDLHFEQISAIFSGVADLKKSSRRPARVARAGRGRFSSSTRSIASTARSRIPFCPSWKTAPSCWSAPPRRIHPSS
jgi:putative ATPase